MRSLLEKAIVHLLNEDQDAAEALFHQFMVERARQIHASLRQGDEVALSEGWDDEIKHDEYFADDDLTGMEDDADMEGKEDMDGETEMDADADVDADMEPDMDADVDVDADVTDRLESFEDKLEALTREYEELVAQVEGGEEGEGDEFEDMKDDFEDVSDTEGDEGDEGDDEEHMMHADSEMEEDDMAMHDESDEMEDECMTEEEEGMMDEEDLDDITESVIAELEKVMAPKNVDHKGIGDGDTFKGNDASPLPMEPVEKRSGSKTVNPDSLMSKQSQHDSFERETPPKSKEMPALKNRKGATTNKAVPKGGDSSALLNKDFAPGRKKSDKSTID